jgi:hypothetical protein
MPASPQAFHDDRLPSLARVHRCGDTSGQRTGDGAACRIGVLIRGPEKGARTGAKNGGSGRFLVELALIPGKRLAGGKIALEGSRGLSVEDRRVIGAAVRAGSKRGRREEE